MPKAIVGRLVIEKAREEEPVQETPKEIPVLSESEPSRGELTTDPIEAPSQILEEPVDEPSDEPDPLSPVEDSPSPIEEQPQPQEATQMASLTQEERQDPPIEERDQAPTDLAESAESPMDEAQPIQEDAPVSIETEDQPRTQEASPKDLKIADDALSSSARLASAKESPVLLEDNPSGPSDLSTGEENPLSQHAQDAPQRIDTETRKKGPQIPSQGSKTLSVLTGVERGTMRLVVMAERPGQLAEGGPGQDQGVQDARTEGDAMESWAPKALPLQGRTAGTGQKPGGPQGRRLGDILLDGPGGLPRGAGLGTVASSGKEGPVGTVTDLVQATGDNRDDRGAGPGVADSWDQPVNLGPGVNGPIDDCEPDITPVRDKILYTVGKAGFNADLWFAVQIDGQWRKTEPLGAINTADDEIDGYVSADGQWLFFYSNRPNGSGWYDLWCSKFQDGQWASPTNLGPQVNSPANDYDPFCNETGTVLYFSSNRNATQEEDYDLYVTTCEAGQWQPPVRIDAVSTEACEWEPWVIAGGNMLFFCSNRTGSVGGFDIWVSLKRGGQWQPPSNCGPAINSSFHEMDPAISPDGQTIFFASDRPGGQGAVDLWQMRFSSVLTAGN